MMGCKSQGFCGYWVVIGNMGFVGRVLLWNLMILEWYRWTRNHKQDEYETFLEFVLLAILYRCQGCLMGTDVIYSNYRHVNDSNLVHKDSQHVLKLPLM